MPNFNLHFVSLVHAIPLFVLTIPLLLVTAQIAYADDTKRILVLHSYHQGFSWTDHITEGVKSVVDEAGIKIELEIEYMDSKRHSPETLLPNLNNLYAVKYGKKQPDVIISSDNIAFDFLLKNRNSLFPGVPVVFSGVNNFKDSMLDNHTDITGVVEDIDLEGTLDLALKLHPKTRQIVIVSDVTKTAMVNLERFRESYEKYSHIVSFTELTGLSIQEFEQALNTLPEDALVIYGGIFRDRLGNVFTMEEGLNFLIKNCSVPVYSLWESLIARGVAGGVVVSGYHQGMKAAQEALKVLQGVDIETIPIIKISPNIPMFDYTAMVRFGINQKLLPDNTIVINAPESVYERYWMLFYILITGFVFLLVWNFHLKRNIDRWRKSEARLKLFREQVDQSRDAIYVIDAVTSDFIDVNQGACKMLGYSYEDLLQLGVTDIAPAFETLEKWQATSEATRKIKGGVLVEHFHRTKSGSQIPVEVNVAYLPDDRNGLFIASARNISERKRAETELLNHKRQLDDAQKMAHIGSWSWNISEDEIVWSSELYRIIGRHPADFEPTYLGYLDCIYPQDRESFKALTKHVMSEKSPYSAEYRIVRPDGDVRYVAEHGSLEVDEAGNPVKMLGVVQDITDSKQAALEREQMQRELSQAHKMEALGQLTGGIAHDFNNILAIIMGSSGLAMKLSVRAGQDKVAAYLEKILRASERARDLVAQMMTFSRTDGSESEPMDILPLVKEDVKMIRPTLPSSIEIVLVINPDEKIPKVLINPVQMHQILLNLSINARDAMNGKGTLTIGLGMTRIMNTECRICHQRISGEWVELLVGDNGSGISADNLQRLFDPFFTTKEVGKGTGMGLAVVHGIVRSHGGHILVESNPDCGTTFRLLFPPVVEEVPELTERSQSSEVSPRGQGRHVLVLDDEPDLAGYIGDLMELYDYKVTIATDSLEALKLLQEHPSEYSLLVTDQTMPRLTGMELINKIRELQPGFPVILCSGYSENIDKEGAERRGIRYISKPIDSDSLLHAAGDLLKSR